MSSFTTFHGQDRNTYSMYQLIHAIIKSDSLKAAGRCIIKSKSATYQVVSASGKAKKKCYKITTLYTCGEQKGVDGLQQFKT